MSVLSLLVAGVAAKFIPPDIEVTKLKAEIDDLKRRLEDVERNRDGWEALARSWRARYETLPQAQLSREQVDRLMLQSQARAQQYAQMVFQQQNVGMLGAQNLQLPSNYCHCVPGRHEALLGGINQA